MLSSEKSPKILAKLLPQILDEMEANIKMAAEAARRAESAARRAGEAAKSATQASTEAERRAEEARKAGETAAQEATVAAREAAVKFEQAARAAMIAAKEAAKKTEETDISDTGARKLLVVFEKANDNYSAYSPDVPGCIATGRTLSEVKKTIRKAIKFHIEGLQEDGMPLPEPISFTEYIRI